MDQEDNLLGRRLSDGRGYDKVISKILPLSLSSPSTESGLQTSLFFTLLPPEIRRYIYVLCFEHGTIHLDWIKTRMAQPTPHSVDGAIMGKETWRWRASTCHRDPDWPVSWDSCFRIFPESSCRKHETSCRPPAVLGLFLACRQAHVEAAEVFYGKNTFHITSDYLLLHAEEKLGSMRQLITRMVVRVGEPSGLQSGGFLGLTRYWATYQAIVKGIRKNYPSLRHLTLHIQRAPGLRGVPKFTRGELTRDLDEDENDRKDPTMATVLFGPLDKLVRTEPPLDEFSVLMDKTTLDEVLETEPDGIEVAGGAKAANAAKFFRRYPKVIRSKDESSAAESGIKTGYWVLARNDAPPTSTYDFYQ